MGSENFGVICAACIRSWFFPRWPCVSAVIMMLLNESNLLLSSALSVFKAHHLQSDQFTLAISCFQILEIMTVLSSVYDCECLI